MVEDSVNPEDWYELLSTVNRNTSEEGRRHGHGHYVEIVSQVVVSVACTY